MRTFLRAAIIPFVLLAWMSNSCMEENTMPNNQIRIHFNILSANNESLGVPEGTSLAINFVSANGQNAISFDNVGFHATPTGFVTKTLTLPDNNYSISDCLLLNGEDEIVYATPKFNTELASIATLPLPADYNLAQAAVNVKLLDVTNHKPQEFGYPSFKNPNRGLSIIVTEKGSSKPVDATGYLMSGPDTLSQYAIKAGVNKIALPIELNEHHKLIIARKSYAPYTLLLNTVASSKSQKPLIIVLEPAFTILAHIDYWDLSFLFALGALDDIIVTINWGDGTIETFKIHYYEGTPDEIYHYYAGPGIYPISITGDLNMITVFESHYGQGPCDDIDFRHLSELQAISFSMSHSPAELDLTYNTKLRSVNLWALGELEWIYLPASNSINQVSFHGRNRMTTPSVDAVIDNLYRNTMRKNIRNGSIGWSVDLVEELDSIVGPPSATALAQVKIMKEEYGWILWPDPFDNTSNVAIREIWLQSTEQKKAMRAKPF